MFPEQETNVFDCMIANNMQRVAATVAIPLSKPAELAIILAGTVLPQVEYFASM